MQFQVAVAAPGYEPAAFPTKYPGRFISLHLSVWSTTNKPQAVPIGKGIIDWQKLFAATRSGGVKNYFVEMDFATLRPSAEFLRQMALTGSCQPV